MNVARAGASFALELLDAFDGALGCAGDLKDSRHRSRSSDRRRR